MIYAFGVDVEPVATSGGMYAGFAKIQLPVQDTARIAWELMGVDYQVKVDEENDLNIFWGDVNLHYESGVIVGLFMADQGALLDGNGDLRSINFGLDNPTLVDNYVSDLMFPVAVEKVGA